jgi:hypothetical protein
MHTHERKYNFLYYMGGGGVGIERTCCHLLGLKLTKIQLSNFCYSLISFVIVFERISLLLKGSYSFLGNNQGPTLDNYRIIES